MRYVALLDQWSASGGARTWVGVTLNASVESVRCSSSLPADAAGKLYNGDSTVSSWSVVNSAVVHCSLYFYWRRDDLIGSRLQTSSLSNMLAYSPVVMWRIKNVYYQLYRRVGKLITWSWQVITNKHFLKMITVCHRAYFINTYRKKRNI